MVVVIWRTWNSCSSSHRKTFTDISCDAMAQVCRPGDLNASLSPLASERNVLSHQNFSRVDMDLKLKLLSWRFLSLEQVLEAISAS